MDTAQFWKQGRSCA